MNKKVYFITGISKGFGKLLTKKLLDKDQIVIGTSRTKLGFEDFKSYSNFLGLTIKDFNDDIEVSTAIETGLNKFKTIDVLINNAGYGQMGPFETISQESIKKVFDVNVFGMMNVTRHILPIMRKNKKGRIINFSSTAGIWGPPLWSIYSSTKFAVQGWTEALVEELKPFKIDILTINPGPYRTEFLSAESLKSGDLEIEDYIEISRANDDMWFNYDKKQNGDPDKGMDLVIDISNMKNVPSKILLGVDAILTGKKVANDMEEAVKISNELSNEK